MLDCKFFARNQQKHWLVVELPSFKEEATFEPSCTAEFCATRGILRAPFHVIVSKGIIMTFIFSIDFPWFKDSRFMIHDWLSLSLVSCQQTSSLIGWCRVKGRPKNSSRGTKLLCTPTSKSCSLFETPWFNRQMMLLLIPCKKIASQHDCKNEFANMVEFFGICKA